jgi:hypothetical protein
MTKLPIADCRLPIGNLLPRRSFARGGHDGRKLIGFSQERGQLALGHRSGFDEQFEPQRGFVRFFLDGSDFCDEFSLAAGAATGAVVRGHRSAAADNLFGNDASGVVGLGDGACELDDSQRKCFCASFEFSGIHGANLQTQSAIGNRQSAIQK